MVQNFLAGLTLINLDECNLLYYVDRWRSSESPDYQKLGAVNRGRFGWQATLLRPRTAALRPTGSVDGNRFSGSSFYFLAHCKGGGWT